jgi:hypothetical protein
LYSVTYESPAGAKGVSTKVSFGEDYETQESAVRMASSIYEAIVTFATMVDYRKKFKKNLRPVPSGFVLEIFLVKFSPYTGELGELYGYIRCKELLDG